ncbi:MAG: hypothetical protein Q7V88_08505 [Actinomycetota bacterium]|nr:hypothetical protein [Actinomycetota bacterium]
MMKATAMEALRRFWWIALLFAIGGAVLGAIPEPSKAADAVVTYRAEHVLLVKSDNGSIFADPIATNQLTLYAVTGEVPKRVAARFGLGTDEAAELAASSHISTPVLDATTGALVIQAADATAELAVQYADAFAEELTKYLAELQEKERTNRANALLAQAQQLQADIAELQREAAADPDDRLVAAELDALSREYSVVFEQQYGDQYNQTSTLTLNTLRKATAIPVSSGAGGLGAPDSRLGRGATGLAVGAVIGSFVALITSRLDRRVRSRAQAELLYGGQVSVVIPDVSGAGNEVAVRPERHDQLSDSYRTLRSMLSFAEAARTAGDGSEPRGAAVTLVVSPGSGDGKTSIAANLAAALVETNKRTIAINTDFRRPTLAARLLGHAPDPLPFSLAELSQVPPRQLLRRTPLTNLVLLDLSGIDAPPGTLARATTRVLEPLSEMADSIVIDSSPVGATAEVLELLPFADHVVVAIRLDHTLTSATQRTMQLLRSLSTGTLHLVVVGENIERSPYYEYGNSSGKRSKRKTGTKTGTKTGR